MYRSILCPVDGGEVSSRGLNEALRLAKYHNATVYFLYVLDLGPLVQYPFGDEALTSLRRIGQGIVDDALSAARSQDVPAQGSMVEIDKGRVGPAVVAQAERLAPDLIVMGTHGRQGLSRLLLGSDAATVVSKTRAPVLLVK